MKPLRTLVTLFCLSTLASSALTIGTYNIRYANKQDREAGNGWERRAPVIASMIRFHGFDVIGTQEGLESQMQDLRKLLPEYELVSYGRDDGKLAGEQMGVLFRKDRLEALESGRFWLSETPDQPGKAWDAALPRLCTWVKLRDKKSGNDFTFFATHLDHIGQVARDESAKLLSARVAAIAGEGAAAVVGDFNSGQDSAVYKTMTAQPNLTDACKRAKISLQLNGTFNAFQPDFWTPTRIDYVFVSPQLEVLRYGVLTDTYRTPDDANSPAYDNKDIADGRGKKAVVRTPSDHYPILVEISDP